MTRQAIALLAMVCVAVPVLGQEIIFFDDFETDSGLWYSGMGDPATPAERAVDPLDPTNHTIIPSGGCDGCPTGGGLAEMWSAPIPVDWASTYVLSFRFLDESPEFQRGGVGLLVEPGWGYVFPVQLIADGSWHDYSLEFVPGELFDPGNGNIMISLIGPLWCRDPLGYPFWFQCEGETPNYYDDIIIQRVDPVPSEASTWGRAKALFR